jgi:hypothetical protein
MAKIRDRLKHAWNAFSNQQEENQEATVLYSPGTSYGRRPDQAYRRFSNERSIISSIYTRLSLDVAQADLRHVRLDDDDRYLEEIDSGLNNCLKVEANIDQSPLAFKQDIAYSLFDDGVVAIVPVDTTISPTESGSFDVKTMRVGQIVKWHPEHVRVRLYNEKTGKREEVTLPKKTVVIVENPFYSVMNEPNSTLQRLIRKLNLLDSIDEQSGSGKLDLIIQLPYVVKNETRRMQAQQRKDDIEFQLKNSQYGIAYTDATEKITQLNRPAENNLMAQVEYLTTLLYSQLGLTDEIMKGSADEATMVNYYNRTIEPILTAITEGMRRVLLTKTARTQKQSITYLRDPFKLAPINTIAEIADKFTRNEILTSNEVRSIVGRRPVKDAKADKLQNSNMPVQKEPQNVNDPSNNGGNGPSSMNQKGDSQNGA